MIRLIDANIILRYLLGDHPEMSEEARKIIEEGAFTIPEVIAEVVYVLKGVYKVEREEISGTLKDFLDEVGVENHAVVCEALTMYAKSSLDFVDCILIARNYLLGETVASFDKKLNRMLKEHPK